MANPVSAAKPSHAGSSSQGSTNRDGLNLDSIKDELRRLSVANQELLQSFSARDSGSGQGKNRAAPTVPGDQLAKENAELKRRIVDLEGELANLTPESWAEQQRNFEQLLDEKSEIIRTLNHKIQSLTESGSLGASDYEQEKLQALAADLQARDEMLRADEEAMQMQVREMEMRMSKERAELARQKAQIDRLQADFERELEVAGRDPNLRDRLRNLQRGDSRPRPSTQPTLDPTASQNGTSQNGASLSESRSVFRRMFGGG